MPDVAGLHVLEDLWGVKEEEKLLPAHPERLVIVVVVVRTCTRNTRKCVFAPLPSLKQPSILFVGSCPIPVMPCSVNKHLTMLVKAQ